MRLLLALLLLAAPLSAQTDSAPPDLTPIEATYRYATRAQWMRHLDLYFAAMGVDALPACANAPVGFAASATTRGVTSARTERTLVTDASGCRGVITLGSATRYRAHRWCNGAWLSSPTLSASRAAALTATLTPCPTP